MVKDLEAAVDTPVWKGDTGDLIPVTPGEHGKNDDRIMEGGEILEGEEEKSDKKGNDEITKHSHKGGSPTRKKLSVKGSTPPHIKQLKPKGK